MSHKYVLIMYTVVCRLDAIIIIVVTLPPKQLTKCLIRVGEKKSIHCHMEEKNQVRDQVDQEEDSPICPPLVLQQTCYHWVP